MVISRLILSAVGASLLASHVNMGDCKRLIDAANLKCGYALPVPAKLPSQREV